MRRFFRVSSGLVGLGAALLGCPGTLDDPARFLRAAGDDAAFTEEAAVGDDATIAAGDVEPAGDAAPARDVGLTEVGDRSSEGASCPDVPQAVLGPNCTGAGCHNAQDKTQGLDLQSPDVGTRLVGVPARGGPGLLIDSSAPSSSVLYTKLTSTPPFGARMPLTGALDDPTIACVLAWIAHPSNDAGSSGSGTLEAGGGAQAGHSEGGRPESGL
jgi:hypothetical protein